MPMYPGLKKYFSTCLLLMAAYFTQAQNSFIQSQKASFRVAGAFSNHELQMQKEFAEKGLAWPAKYVLIRSFKFDSQLEVWVKNESKEKFKLYKTYKVCMTSGTMGPKRLQGDYQVPEGFYYINEFNPRSNYHLSLGLNYPNASDRILSDSLRPGNGIFIHGSCVSVGCIPVNDNDIEEIYLLSSYAREAGQEFIPVHVFPVRYNNKKSYDYFLNNVKNNKSLEQFGLTLKKAYDYFEAEKELPLILVDKAGNYIIE